MKFPPFFIYFLFGILISCVSKTSFEIKVENLLKNNASQEDIIRELGRPYSLLDYEKVKSYARQFGMRLPNNTVKISVGYFYQVNDSTTLIILFDSDNKAAYLLWGGQ